MSSLKEKFVVYDAADLAWREAKKALEAATVVRSNAVKAIAEEIAPKKKLLREGCELTIVVRGETYFFRGKSDKSDLVEV